MEKVNVRNTFFLKGIQLCVDGREVDVIRKILTQKMELAIQRQEVGERVFRAIGESAPAFGMVDTLVGLAHDSLPPGLRETAYVLACDVAAADGKVSQEKIRLLEMLRHGLTGGRLPVAAIERAARARFATG